LGVGGEDGDRAVSVIAGASNTVIATVTVGSDPQGVAVDESTDTD
jgi:YVTN family beta-propeller protein